MKRGSFSKPRTPLSRGKSTLRQSRLGRGRSRMRQRSFTEKYPADHPGPDYGPLFRVLQAKAKAGYCELCALGYEGPSHKIGDCALGVQGGPTAHHFDNKRHIDEKGLTPCGGAAHDLLANKAGRRAMLHFRVWMKLNRYTLESIGLECIRKTKEVME